MEHWFRLLARTCLVVSASVSPVVADDDHDRARRAFEAGDILPLGKVLEAAEAAHPGIVLEVELDREDGRWVYEIEILTPSGAILELEYDAATGDLLEMGYEDDD